MHRAGRWLAVIRGERRKRRVYTWWSNEWPFRWICVLLVGKELFIYLFRSSMPLHIDLGFSFRYEIVCTDNMQLLLWCIYAFHKSRCIYTEKCMLCVGDILYLNLNNMIIVYVCSKCGDVERFICVENSNLFIPQTHTHSHTLSPAIDRGFTQHSIWAVCTEYSAGAYGMLGVCCVFM